MNSYYKTQHRNNGKSKHRNVMIKNNHAEPSNAFTQNKFHYRDLSLFKMAMAFNVKPNNRQRLKWFFNLAGCPNDFTLKHEAETICSRYGFVGIRTISVTQERAIKRLIIDTPFFLFTLDNVISFSNDLRELAIANSAYYERWEVVPKNETLFKRISRFFK